LVALTKVCERSLGANQGGPSMPLVQPFVRGEMLPSGFLVRPSDGGGSVIHIVDHMDLEVIMESRKIKRQLLLIT
jgi:homeobox-leucine zipper protein